MTWDDPWELRKVADDPAVCQGARELAAVWQNWIENAGDYPAAYRVRDDNTDRITGLPFNTKIPPLRNAELPPQVEQWGPRAPPEAMPPEELEIMGCSGERTGSSSGRARRKPGRSRLMRYPAE